MVHCESSGNAYATDGYNDGWFQIARAYHTRRLREDLGEYTLYDGAANTRIANEIYQEQGPGPWPYCGRFF